MPKIPLTSLGGLLIVAAFKLGQMNPTVAIASNPEPPSPSEPPVHHIVLIKLQPDVTPEEIEQTIEDNRRLISAIPGVLEVSLGPKARDDREVHLKDYDLGLYVKLSNNADLDIYGPHPNHQEFLARNRSKIANIRVIDFYGE
ncbi:Dabb family protein [Oscillatoria acuminata]|uniref:Stress responsive A/B Barrel Domain-containing protein n=1 Tax=Oscillatoria acuminata PCC 6304 TaxID=56110 RepID=K9TLX3_9CYAN|nr:Dabb family protein [Oscillatoria acuminata]AFY83535.1 Stress responsive A/B Barrel Domain-containing protein [Oscillatoria acuminata PCC 6304]